MKKTHTTPTIIQRNDSFIFQCRGKGRGKKAAAHKSNEITRWSLNKNKSHWNDFFFIYLITKTREWTFFLLFDYGDDDGGDGYMDGSGGNSTTQRLSMHTLTRSRRTCQFCFYFMHICNAVELCARDSHNLCLLWELSLWNEFSQSRTPHDVWASNHSRRHSIPSIVRNDYILKSDDHRVASLTCRVSSVGEV